MLSLWPCPCSFSGSSFMCVLIFHLQGLLKHLILLLTGLHEAGKLGPWQYHMVSSQGLDRAATFCSTLAPRKCSLLPSCTHQGGFV